jgi:hypothetical protein
VNTFLKAPLSTAVPLAITVKVTGPWAAAADSVCANVTSHVTSTTTNAGMAALAAESDGGAGTLCVSTVATGSWISLWNARVGAPVTPSLVGQVPSTAQFSLRLSGASPVPLYDGKVFSPEKLATATSLSDAGGAYLVLAGDNVLHDTELSATAMTIRLLP